MTKVTLPVATRLTLQSEPDGTHTAIMFETANGVIGVAVHKPELSRMTALLIEQAGKVAAAITPGEPPKELTTTPILASHLGFSQGRSPTEAFVSFQVGNLITTFAVELSMLLEQYTHLRTNSSVAQSKPTTN